MILHGDQFQRGFLGDLFDLEYGSGLPERVRSGVGYPVFGSNGIVGRHSDFLVQGPGIVVGRKGSVGEVCWSTESFWPIDTAYYVVPKRQTDFRWLFWLLSSTDMKSLDAATGVPGLNRNDVYEVQAHIPEVAEQSRIAAVLDTVDEAIAKTEAVISKLKQMRAGLLHDLLTRGLDENGQLRDPVAHPEQFQDSPIGRIPRRWEIRKIGVLIAGFESGVSVDSVDIPASEGEIGVLKTSCLTGGIFNPLESKVVKPHERAHVNCRPRHDSIIISRMNTPQLVGESAYVESDFDHLFLPDRLWQTIKLPYDPTCIRWLSYVFQSPELRDKISAGATGTSGSMKNVSQMFVLGLDVRVPPRDEQQQIAETLGQQEEACHCEEAVLKKLRNLKSALMADLLTGRVRVPADIFQEHS